MNKATKLTIQNIAKKAQVSQSTVSRVLSGNAPVAAAKREAVLAAVAAIEMGHRHIAHVSAPMYYHGPINDIYQRYQGYVQALTEAGIELDEQLVVEGDLSRQSGLLALQKLVGGKRPFTAIFAANDQMAVGIRLGLHRRGLRVPEDISLIGFDDEPTSAYLTPPLTTMHQPAIELGQASAQAILDLINGNPQPNAAFQTELIIRESVAHRRKENPECPTSFLTQKFTR